MMLVEKPDEIAGPPEKLKAWQEFLRKSRNILKPPETIQGCPEGFWLLPIDSDFRGLSMLVCLAERTRDVSYKIFLIDGELISLHESNKHS
jgi:hypothetical protein